MSKKKSLERGGGRPLIPPERASDLGGNNALKHAADLMRENLSLALGAGATFEMDAEMSPAVSCPKFSGCNAPICPLDAGWHERRILSMEPVCFYLLEHAKEGSEARFKQRGLGQLYEVIHRVLPGQLSKWGRVARAYARAKKSGSRLERLPIWVKVKEHVET